MTAQGQLEALPLPGRNGGYPVGNPACAEPLRGYRIAPIAVAYSSGSPALRSPSARRVASSGE